MPISPAFIDVDHQSLTKALCQLAAMAETMLARQLVPAGVSPAGTAGDYVVAVYTVPVNNFGPSVGQLQNLYISAAGKFAANGNTKRAKIIVGATNPTVGQLVSGGTVIADTGASTGNNVGWLLQTQIFRSGANTQLAVQDGAAVGTTHLGVLSPAALTLNDNATIPICVVLNNTTTASDAIVQYFETDGMA